MRSIIYTFILFFLLPVFSFANSDTTHIDIRRQSFHEKIQLQQNRADKLDGRLDGIINLSPDNEVNLQITDALIRKVNVLRNEIEISDSLKTNNDKVRSLRSLEMMISTFISDWRNHTLKASMAPVLVDNFTQLFYADLKNEPILPYLKDVPFEIAAINIESFPLNKGYKEAKIYLFRKLSVLYPDRILANLGPYTEEPFADTLIFAAYKYAPSQLYSYAQSVNSKQGKLIHSIDDNRIKMIVKLSKQPRALFYFPLLDDLVSGKQTLESIEKTVGTSERSYDSVGYYKLLVKTAIDYHGRVIKGDTPVALSGSNGLLNMLQKRAIQHFIDPINVLHESPNPIRFRAIEPLTAEELYYMMVMGENDIYTSSYKYSFDKMLQKMGTVPHGDSLLISVNFDKFKKFIKMAAGYAKLDQFLNTMSQANADKLMQAFVAKLESSGTLEDAVDVADSYGSVSPKVQQSMLKNVEWNEQRCKAENNTKGQNIYGLLKTIFLSADPKNGVDLTKELGIPPIYTVANNYLSDDKGRIIQQVFFYGDSDGKMSFASYMSSFSSNEWNIVRKKEWVEIKSKTGKPVWIFANLPLDNDTDKDAEAQSNLINYLNENDLKPTVIIHRGHSYHLPYTIQQLPENAKIIMLGSCGGYQNLKNILNYAPEAHIISTKQTGTMNVNKSIIDALDNSLRLGKDIDWRQMWDGLSSSFSHASKDVRETFEDYIPPQKNLGALFIKAYTKMGGDTD